MSYCTATDVQNAMAGRRIVFADSSAGPPATVGTIPSLTQVSNYIDQVASEIDQAIERGGFQPPTVTNLYLTMCNAMGAAYLAEMDMQITGTSEGMSVVKMRGDEYQRRLQNIEANPRIAGAIPAEGSPNAQFVSDGTSNYTKNWNTNTPFHRDYRDW